MRQESRSCQESVGLRSSVVGARAGVGGEGAREEEQVAAPRNVLDNVVEKVHGLVLGVQGTQKRTEEFRAVG